MRKFIAFITLAFSLLVATIVGVPLIKENINNGAEFNGGYSILYHVAKQNGNEYSKSEIENVVDKAISKLSDRLNTLSVSNPEISVVNDNNILVSIPEVDVESDAHDEYGGQLGIIRYALANNGQISIRDVNDNDLLPEGYEISDVIKEIKLVANGDSVYTTVKLKNTDVFKEITSSLASSYSGSEDNPTANFVIWMGFEEDYSDEMIEHLKDEDTEFKGDHYSDIDHNPYAAFKILSRIAIDETIEEDFTLNSYVSLSNVSLYNKILSEESNKYALNEVYTVPTGSYRNVDTPTFAMVAGIVSLVAIAVVLFIIYRLAGLVSALSIVAYTVLTLLAYTLFGGLFGAETIIGMMVGIVLAIGANIIFLEKIKNEIRKGKLLSRAYDEGSKKSVSAVLDSNIVILILSLALYLFGSQVIKSFAALMIISQIIIILIVVLLTRLMLSQLCNSSFVTDVKKVFGVSKDEIKDINNVEAPIKENKFSKVNFVNKAKTKFCIGGIIAAVGLTFAIIFGIFGTTFNTPSSLGKGTIFSFRTINSNYSTVEKVCAAFEDESLVGSTPNKVIISEDYKQFETNDLNGYSNEFSKYIGADYMEQIHSNKVKVYSITVYYDSTLTRSTIDSVDAVFEIEKNDLYVEDEIDILKTNYFSGNFKSYTGKMAALNGALVLSMACLFLFIYLLIKFNLAIAVTSIVQVLINEALFLALAAVIRFTLGSELIALCAAVLVLTVNNLSYTFDQLKENVSVAKDTIWSKETREQFANISLQQTAFGNVFTLCGALTIAVLLMAFIGWSIFSIPFFSIIAVAVTAFGSYFLMPHIWVLLDGQYANIKNKIKQKRALKEANQEKSNEPEEYVFFGIND